MTPWTVAHQAPLSMEFFKQEYRSEGAISFSNSYVESNLKSDTNEVIDREVTDIGDKFMATRWETWRGGINQEVGINKHTILYILYTYISSM